jgi:hypothetical protein
VVRATPPVCAGGFFCDAPDLRAPLRGEGAGTDQVNAIATKPEQSRTRPAMVTARKLFEANSSRMVHHLSLGNAGHRFDYRVLEQNDCPLAQSKDSLPNAQFRPRVMLSCNTRLGPRR